MVTVGGIFVGGQSRRMGGQPKGRLVSPDGVPIVTRWASLFEALRIPAVLVGDAAAYRDLGLAAIADDPGAAGPLAGLIALLRHAGDGHTIAVACDMPYVSRHLLERLAAAPPASIVAPKRAGRWEPFFARYDAARALPCARAHAHRGALQAVLDDACAVELPLSPDEARELRDWDAPGDMAGDMDG